MEQFKKEVTFLSKVFSQNEGDAVGAWVEEPISKKATFKSLSRTDRSQHKLHFKIISIFEHFGAKEGEQMKIDSDGVYELSVKAIETLLITDKEFTDQDKIEFLNDSAAIFEFGFWLLGEKIAPFFSTFSKKSPK